MPAVASAATFTVTTTEDLTTEGCATECSLRTAIEDANANDEADVIKFAVAGRIEVEGEQLPEITSPIEIDGTSAPGYEISHTPVVLLDGSDLEGGEGGPDEGLVVGEGGEGTVISGLAIGGFQYGVWIHDAGGARLCASYIGVEPDGETALPNEVGVEASPGEGGGGAGLEAAPDAAPGAVELGAGCGAGLGGNLISGNGKYGVADYAEGTEIAGNRIGVDINGAPLPNGTDPQEGEGPEPRAGIFISNGGGGGTIGLPGAGNVIADNEGPGVLDEEGEIGTEIRGNSIYGNEGLGIEVMGEAVPFSPTVDSAEETSPGRLHIEGRVQSNPETIEVDFYASEACGPGEGQVYLGAGRVENTTDGEVHYETDLEVTVPPEHRYITATATGSATRQTTEFSGCVRYVPGPRTFTVNTTEDTTNSGECTIKCSLRDAITLANETEAADTIDFGAGGEGTIRTTEPLPRIEGPVTIDATSAPGYEGEPVVAIDGGSNDKALDVEGPGEAVIKGLAVGNSHYAIYLGGVGHSQVCASWLGLGLGGVKRLSGAGIFIPGNSTENEVGVGCGEIVAPNVIAGNSAWGIEDFGIGTGIGGNQVGVSPEGSPMPNGAGGIRIAEGADGQQIGGTGAAAGSPEPNEIAYNEGVGVLVEEGVSQVAIRANAIFSNEGKGIEIAADAPEPPTITSVGGDASHLEIKGETTGSDGPEAIELDFFASALCEPGVTGEGERYLGSATVSNAGGTQSYEATIAAATTADQPFVTATSTAFGESQTSEFSNCFRYVSPEPEPEPEPKKEEPKKESTTNTQPEEPSPTNGESVIVVPKEGTILIKLPGSGKYVPLEELKEIPVGAIIDATKGKVTLTSIGPNGEEQTAVFFGGIFKVKQKEGSNVVVLEIIVNKICRGGMVKQGGTSATASSVATASAAGGKKGGKLWGSGHGSFKTEGNQGSATVRGTIWLVEDRCDGTTFFKTKRGVVTVNDFFSHKKLSLPAGKTYVAGEE